MPKNHSTHPTSAILRATARDAFRSNDVKYVSSVGDHEPQSLRPDTQALEYLFKTEGPHHPKRRCIWRPFFNFEHTQKNRAVIIPRDNITMASYLCLDSPKMLFLAGKIKQVVLDEGKRLATRYVPGVPGNRIPGARRWPKHERTGRDGTGF
ncbi:hypothetical protein FQN53_003013 [Emmonsiellopsis sp. PD_33]|nr:hypothetical protein FQN53_003013 [Emmonsiellopsis sp. PD_33]